MFTTERILSLLDHELSVSTTIRRSKVARPRCNCINKILKLLTIEKSEAPGLIPKPIFSPAQTIFTSNQVDFSSGCWDLSRLSDQVEQEPVPAVFSRSHRTGHPSQGNKGGDKELKMMDNMAWSECSNSATGH